MSTTCHKHEQRHVIKFNILNNITTFGVLHTPVQACTPYPLVIILHGLASNKIGSKRTHVQLAENLTQCGIAALRVDLPGHGDSEGSLYDFSFSDYINSANEIVSYGYGLNTIDTKNIAIFGSSLGATLALLNMPTLPYVKSLAVWAPTIQGAIWLQEAINIPNTILAHAPASEDILYAGMPINKTFCSQFIQMDVTKEVPKFSDSLSILHMQGEDDTTVSLHHQKIFATAMSQKPNPFEMRTYPNVGHHVPLSCSMLSELVQWLKHQLIP
ncbi:alpha/beta hydrolase [Chlamydia caviae]|uniref:Dienelactone hydrolase family protein n=1 Tax=Chlamydia caviae (strain ATCC VR-813 / DSM 19441 / 03DC25 / GPIC) TaxID=227941 RepID=Q822S0_CHLCV|nr:alpha/beta hydrolase [Chlamydia caviae]AAP05351.1 dienelactone hydrolase family protein [Chlamydia caviae GPIC]